MVFDSEMRQPEFFSPVKRLLKTSQFSLVTRKACLLRKGLDVVVGVGWS